MKLTLFDVHSQPQQVQAIWCELCQLNSPSYFLSWGWIEHWLSCLPASLAVQLAVIYQGDRPWLAFFVGQGRQVRHHLFRSRTVSLNATGLPQIDYLYIEYNAMLCAERVNCSLQKILELLPAQWDEFMMPGLDPNAFPGNALQQPLTAGKIIVESKIPSPYVDLDLVRQHNGNYLALLNKSTRSTITRSYKGYEERGAVTLEVGADLSTALDIFEEMVELHRTTWRERGKASAFTTDFLLDFHRELIRKRMEWQEIQLLRIRAGSTTIGCLYNFVFQNRVLFYQSGFHYETERRLSPGYTCLVEAIQYNAAQGYACFDFLASDDYYKSRLSTGENHLLWIKIQKPRIQFYLEAELKALKARYFPDKVIPPVQGVST